MILEFSDLDKEFSTSVENKLLRNTVYFSSLLLLLRSSAGVISDVM